MRWSAVVAVAILATASGCAGAFSQPSTPTVTPVPVPTDASDGHAAYPAGVDATGVTNVSELADGHRRAIRGYSYSWRTRKCERVVGDGAGSERRCGTDAVVYESDRRYRYAHEDGPDRDVISSQNTFEVRERYVNGTAAYARFQSGDAVVYERRRVDDRSPGFRATADRFVRLYLSVEESSARRVRADGRTYVRIVGRDSRAPIFDDASDYRVTALVDRRGIVTRIEVSFNRTRDGRTVHHTFRSRYEDVGNATVEPPEWLPAAKVATAPNGTATADSTA